MKITLSVLKKIREHAKETFPEECCGLLIGKSTFDNKGETENTVFAIKKCTNVWEGDRMSGFEISLSEMWEAEIKAREVGLEIIGNYHSHTDAAAVPSCEDERHCRIYNSMLIISIENGIIEEMKSWKVGPMMSVTEEPILFI